jgi:hypothetical protein
VNTGGSSFDSVVGYIKYPEKDSSVFVVEGETGTAGGDIEIIAKNVESDEMYRSWRPVYRMQDGETVRIIQTEAMAPGTLHREAYIVHTVSLPPNATAWINVSNITKTTPNEELIEDVELGENIDTEAGSEQLDEGDLDTFSVPEITDEQNVEEELNVLTLAELEDAWTLISKEPVMGAELAPLHDLYGQLLEENVGDIVVERIAAGRMKQLDVWKQLQFQTDRIASLREKLGAKSGDVEEFVAVMNTFGEYTVVGKIALSNTFNGKIRPLMFRIQNSSGRTMGYVPANPDWDFSSMIGQVVGVNGVMNWDPSWRVHVVDVKGFDLLAPTTAEVESDIQ